MLKSAFGVEKLPPVNGFITPNKVLVVINDVKMVEDVFVNQNKYHSKDQSSRD